MRLVGFIEGKYSNGSLLSISKLSKSFIWLKKK
jgi:hypothetical protein